MYNMQENLRSDSGVVYKSEEELYFSYWLDEAVGVGLVRKYKYQPLPFVLSSEVGFPTKERGKKEKKNLLLRDHGYQADFLIVWTFKAVSIGLCKHVKRPEDTGMFLFQEKNSELYSVIDTKGSFSRNYNDLNFPINQKWVYSKYGIFVQKVIPFGSGAISNCMFTKTWTPQKYAFRPKVKGGGFLKNQCEVKLLNEYLAKTKL